MSVGDVFSNEGNRNNCWFSGSWINILQHGRPDCTRSIWMEEHASQVLEAARNKGACHKCLCNHWGKTMEIQKENMHVFLFTLVWSICQKLLREKRGVILTHRNVPKENLHLLLTLSIGEAPSYCISADSLFQWIWGQRIWKIWAREAKWELLGVFCTLGWRPELESSLCHWTASPGLKFCLRRKLFGLFAAVSVVHSRWLACGRCFNNDQRNELVNDQLFVY